LSSGQFFMQPPQLFGSFCVSTHAMPQSSLPPLQFNPHLPSAHAWPIAHVVPHAPQFFGSNVSTVHVPLQIAVPGPHGHLRR